MSFHFYTTCRDPLSSFLLACDQKSDIHILITYPDNLYCKFPFKCCQTFFTERKEFMDFSVNCHHFSSKPCSSEGFQQQVKIIQSKFLSPILSPVSLCKTWVLPKEYLPPSKLLLVFLPHSICSSVRESSFQQVR